VLSSIQKPSIKFFHEFFTKSVQLSRPRKKPETTENLFNAAQTVVHQFCESVIASHLNDVRVVTKAEIRFFEWEEHDHLKNLSLSIKK
jgi:CRISPR/Cas system CMR-associated protein Cmr1 (group 7 of RAMP superfamily)